MAIPTLLAPDHATGPTGGGDLVTVRGTGFAATVEVRFGGVRAEIVSVREEAGLSVCVVRTPALAEAVVDIALQNLDVAGLPVPTERVVLASAYRFLRPRIVQQSDLTRLIRTLLREFKRQVLENVSLSVSADFDDTPLDGLDIISVSKLPSLVLTGPKIRENRALSTNEALEEIVQGISGPEIRRRRPALTVDLEFAITGASDRVIELLNMVGATGSFLNSNKWIEMLRDPSAPGKGSVRWEMDPVGEVHVNFEGKEDIRAFSWGLVIRGFDLNEGLPMDLSRAVDPVGTSLHVGIKDKQ